MSTDALYGVFFEDGGNTYLAAVFGARGEAESYAEREVENGEMAEEDFEKIYAIDAVHPEWMDRFPGAWDQLERGEPVIVDG
jgi:hypothetical protein